MGDTHLWMGALSLLSPVSLQAGGSRPGTLLTPGSPAHSAAPIIMYLASCVQTRKGVPGKDLEHLTAWQEPQPLVEVIGWAWPALRLLRAASAPGCRPQ